MKKSVPVMILVLLGCEHEELKMHQSESPKGSSVKIEIAMPSIKGEILSLGGIGENQLTIEKKNGLNIWMGDIVLTDKQVNTLSAMTKKKKNERTALETIRTLWPTATVYFTINPSLPNANRVADAIAHWQNAAPYLRFVQRTTETNYIEFIPGSGCWSSLGMVGGRQTITLQNECTAGNAIHEIGHALGLLHEQTRADRDNTIMVHYNNIVPSAQSQFHIYSEDNIDGFEIGNFDFGSIMLYPSIIADPNFSINPALPVMTLVDGVTEFPAQRLGLSAGDLEIAELLYGPPFASLEMEEVSSSQDWTYEYTEVQYFIRFYADRARTTFAALATPTTVNFLFTQHSYNPPPGNSYSQSYSITLQPGANRYSLGTYLIGSCQYDYGGPIGNCFNASLYLNDGFRYNN
jgi:hypothetical protein